MRELRSVLWILVFSCAPWFLSGTHAQWVAYNDFAWLAPPGSYQIFGNQGGLEMDPDYRVTPGDSSSKLARVTLFTDGNFAGGGQFVDSAFSYMPDPAIEPPGPSQEQAKAGFLRNYETGAALPVHVDVTHTGTGFTWTKQQGATAAEAPGRPSYDEFWDENGNAFIGLWGTEDGNDITSSHTVTLGNLDPDKFYEYVTFGNFGHWGGERNGIHYNWIQIQGYDPDGFQNLSSVDTDYATAPNILGIDASDPRYSEGHEQRAGIRSITDPNYYVQASGEVYFDGWVTKFHFKPGTDGEVQIVTRGTLNTAAMEFANLDDADSGGMPSADPAGVPRWRHEDISGDGTEHLSTRDVANLINGDITDPQDPDFGKHFIDGWKAKTDPSTWPLDFDALEATVGTSVTPSNGGTTNATWYLAGFKLEELAPSIEDADFDGDGDVDGTDFLTWQRGFGTLSGASLNNGDANGDGAVTATDLDIWQSQYGASLAVTALEVPEPSSLLLLAFGAAVWPGRRRRYR